jgi:HPt (histidine-containing phosphotransfer) domain-containing protein
VKPELECRLDPQVLADKAGASSAFAYQLVELFLQDARSRVRTLSIALDARDRSGLRAVAHALAAGAGAVGARRLSVTCHRLEQHVAASGIDDAAAAMVDDITTELTAVSAMFAEAREGRPRTDRNAA